MILEILGLALISYYGWKRYTTPFRTVQIILSKDQTDSVVVLERICWTEEEFELVQNITTTTMIDPERNKHGYTTLSIVDKYTQEEFFRLETQKRSLE